MFPHAVNGETAYAGPVNEFTCGESAASYRWKQNHNSIEKFMKPPTHAGMSKGSTKSLAGQAPKLRE